MSIDEEEEEDICCLKIAEKEFSLSQMRIRHTFNFENIFFFVILHFHDI